MYFGRVVGTVVATIKNDRFEGYKLLVVDRLDLNGEPDGYYDIAVDVVPHIEHLVAGEAQGSLEVADVASGVHATA